MHYIIFFYKTITNELPSDTLLEFGNRIRPLAWKAYPDVDAGLRDEKTLTDVGVLWIL